MRFHAGPTLCARVQVVDCGRKLVANPEHRELLWQGVDVWNAWRGKDPSIRPDLAEANLYGANLPKADLFRAILNGANLSEANLSEAKLGEADLSGANLGGANLNGANLSGANLGEATLAEADLSGANLGGAFLMRANLELADLTAADLSGATLGFAFLIRADLTAANLSGADLFRAILTEANLGGADLHEARLIEANLTEVSLRGANLTKAILNRANLGHAFVVEANLGGADLAAADLSGANLGGANLTKAYLAGANLRLTNLDGADLSDADLSRAVLVETSLLGATLTGCSIYGISAWNVQLNERTKQQGLIITPKCESAVTVDDLEVAQFVYLLLHNEKIRRVIDTVGKKGVLLLGRFTEGRIAVLDRLRDELRKRGYVPIVFNFDKPETKDFTETVRLLAGLSKFVIADLTSPKSAPYELGAIVSQTMIPFQPIIAADETPFSMLQDLWTNYPDRFFRPIHYSSVDTLIASLDEKIIKPAEARFVELLARKAERMRGEHV